MEVLDHLLSVWLSKNPGMAPTHIQIARYSLRFGSRGIYDNEKNHYVIVIKIKSCLYIAVEFISGLLLADI